MTKRITLIAAIGAAGLTLAACSGASDTEQPVAETNVENIAEPDTFENVMMEAPASNVVDNTAAAATTPPPVATLTKDEQTMDDAAATGMTARVSRDEPLNEATTQPAH